MELGEEREMAEDLSRRVVPSIIHKSGYNAAHSKLSLVYMSKRASVNVNMCVLRMNIGYYSCCLNTERRGARTHDAVTLPPIVSPLRRSFGEREAFLLLLQRPLFYSSHLLSFNP